MLRDQASPFSCEDNDSKKWITAGARKEFEEMEYDVNWTRGVSDNAHTCPVSDVRTIHASADVTPKG